MVETRAMSEARAGDWIVSERRSTGEHDRRGLILEVLGAPDHLHFRVRWDEEHESIFYPSGGVTIEPGRPHPHT